MQSTDATKFGELVIMCGEIYDKPVSKERLTMWFQLLSEYDISDIERAVMSHVRESRWMPTPAEIVNRIRPNVKDEALLAWSEVPRLLRNSRSAKSENPITERAVRDLGGWVALGQKTESELVWVAKEFAERYAIHAQHGTEVEALTADRRIMDGVAQIGRVH